MHRREKNIESKTVVTPEKKGSKIRKGFILGGLFVIALGGGFGLGWYVRNARSSPNTLNEVRLDSSQYQYTNPLLYVDSAKPSSDFNGLRASLVNYNNSALKGQSASSSISIYFQDLNTGRWMGINENDLYEPSSMLKVLVMMSYYKQAESDPAVLNKQMQYYATVDPGQYFKPVHPLSTGTYNVSELIEAMIKDSDNTAVDMLDEGNDTNFYNLYNTLQLPPIPSGDNVSDYMSPKAYSALFRTLYNSSYLWQSRSEQALELLSQTSFTYGLVAGVPSGTTVAHKFGEHTVATTDGTIVSRELHDCGIIYYPSDPYLLCVMTRGTDFPTLETIISTISKNVYAAVSGGLLTAKT